MLPKTHTELNHRYIEIQSIDAVTCAKLPMNPGPDSLVQHQPVCSFFESFDFCK